MKEFEKFDSMMKKLVSVPHDESQSQAGHGKTGETKKAEDLSPKFPSVFHRCEP
jgi:hypothetical protein